MVQYVSEVSPQENSSPFDHQRNGDAYNSKSGDGKYGTHAGQHGKRSPGRLAVNGKGRSC